MSLRSFSLSHRPGHCGSEAPGLVCCFVWFPKAGNCPVQDGGSGWAFGNRCSTSLNGEETGAECLLEGTEICVWRADAGNVWFDVYRSLERGKGQRTGMAVPPASLLGFPARTLLWSAWQQPCCWGCLTVELQLGHTHINCWKKMSSFGRSWSCTVTSLGSPNCSAISC